MQQCVFADLGGVELTLCSLVSFDMLEFEKMRG